MSEAPQEPNPTRAAGTDMVSAEPTKSFFVEFLIKDIPLEQAVLDLVDNCIDGARRIGANGTYEGRWVDIRLDSEKFSIVDNCGGFDRATAKDYAFRFGRPSNAPPVRHSIGQFGVGMKRALFKFGRHFLVMSATTNEKWAVDVDVDDWEGKPEWFFEWHEYPEGNDNPSATTPGTKIVVDRLHPEVSARFNTAYFVNLISGLIRSKHRQFIAGRLSISVNGTHLTATSLYLLIRDGLTPGVDLLTFDGKTDKPVNVRIVVGVGGSAPAEAGWYVICNGRVIVEHDRRAVTGWGVLEDEANAIALPTFHNQYARFRGIVAFDCDDPAKVPWNTTKTDIDQDTAVWQKTFERMKEMMRPVIDFLNALDEDVDEYSREHSPMLRHVTTADSAQADTLTTRMQFRAPRRGELTLQKRQVRIQYAKPYDDIEFLQDALDVNSAKAVGEKTFDMVLQRQRGS